jgi:hypothetical protein
MTTNVNINLNNIHISDDDRRDCARLYMERKSIEDKVYHYVDLCYFGDRQSRSELNYDALRIGINNYKFYKNKYLLLDAILEKWLIYFHENMSELEEKIMDKELLLIIKNRIQLL